MVERYRTEYLLPNLKSFNKEINKMAIKWANISMLSFTHGQKAFTVLFLMNTYFNFAR